MAEEIATLGIKVLSNDIIKATKRLDRLENQGKKTEKQTKKMSGAFKLMGGALAAIGVVGLTKSLIGQINTYTGLNNKLKLVTSSAENLATIQKELFNIAQDSRGGLEGTVDLYTRFARSTKELGVSQNELLGITETVNQAIAISGSSAQAADAAIMQLGQGLAAGALRGEELNSVMEQTPRLAQALAEGLGVGIGQLRDMGAAGEITAEKVIKALKKQSENVKSEFDQTAKTVAQAFVQIENVALKTFGSLDATELVAAMDDFRMALEDPTVIHALQNMAGALLNMVTFLVKLPKLLNDTGVALGNFLSELTGNRPRALKEINADIEQLTETLSKRTGRAARGAMHLREELAELRKEREKSISFFGADPDTSPIGSHGAVIPEDQKPVDTTALKDVKALEREEELEARGEFHGLELEQIAERLNAEREARREHKDQMLADEQDYWDRLYSLESGSQKAGLKFALSMRDMDYKSALQNGALMLGNAAKTSEKAFRIQKALALSNAVVTLPSAVMKSYEAGGGFPFGLIPAGLMLSAGMKQISAIKSSSLGGGGSAPSVGGASSGSTSPSAPVASGLPQGSTAVPDEAEQRRDPVRVNITLNGSGYTDQNVRDLVESINSQISDDVVLDTGLVA